MDTGVVSGPHASPTVKHSVVVEQSWIGLVEGHGPGMHEVSMKTFAQQTSPVAHMDAFAHSAAEAPG